MRQSQDSQELTATAAVLTSDNRNKALDVSNLCASSLPRVVGHLDSNMGGTARHQQCKPFITLLSESLNSSQQQSSRTSQATPLPGSEGSSSSTAIAFTVSSASPHAASTRQVVDAMGRQRI